MPEGELIMDYETIIGLEVHVELATASKVFCSCPVEFGGEPNTRVCPVCLGLPGTLPVLNKRAVEFAVRAALALNCEVHPSSQFARKNYFYPDMPKNYQISQYDRPLATGGYVEFEVDGRTVRVGIRRVHMEEDTGKLLHEGVEGGSLVDFNRAGVPLLEIVSEPDIRSPEEARLYLQELRTILLYTGVSDVRMEEGSLRCDANVSIRPRGSREWGTLTEVKNMNSFRSVERALAYEVKRQREIIESGGRVVRETRHWDESRGETFSSRSKEEAHDYRYFPEPDLLPLILDPAWVREIGERMPELPAQRRRRLVEEYGLPAYDAGVLTASKSLGDFFDRTVRLYDDAKAVSNWLMGEVSRVLRERDLDIERSALTPENLASMLRLIDDGTISGKIAKSVLEEMVDTGKDPRAIVEEKGLVQISDEGQLLPLVRRIIEENPGPVADYRGGKKKALGFLVGQVMKETRGKANPQLVNELFRRELG